MHTKNFLPRDRQGLCSIGDGRVGHNDYEDVRGGEVEGWALMAVPFDLLHIYITRKYYAIKQSDPFKLLGPIH